jgi:hypothetical protein
MSEAAISMVGIKDKDSGDGPKITIHKLPPQLIKSWDKELDRLHTALTSPNLPAEDREWVKRQIESIHSKMFGG